VTVSLTLDEVLELHTMLIEATGGSAGVRDLGAIESAVAQPKMTFGGEDLYPSLAAKAAAMAHSLVMSHPFVDGNKRAAHASLETMLILNGFEINADVDDQESVILAVAAGEMSREDFIAWVERHVTPK